MIIFLTALLAIIVISNPKLNDTLIKTFLEFLLILFITGYSLLAALFPKIDDLDSLERIGLSFGLSIVIGPATSFLTANYTCWNEIYTIIIYPLNIHNNNGFYWLHSKKESSRRGEILC